MSARRQIVYGELELSDADRRAVKRGEATILIDPAGRVRAASVALHEAFRALFEDGTNVEALRRVQRAQARVAKLALELDKLAQRRRRIPMPSREPHIAMVEDGHDE